jgi:hypothetical protein
MNSKVKEHPLIQEECYLQVNESWKEDKEEPKDVTNVMREER